MTGWTDIENRVHACFVAATGLANDHVVWSSQRGPDPTSPFMRLTRIVGRSPNFDSFETIPPRYGADGEHFEYASSGTFRVDAQAFGAGATQLIETLRAALARDAIAELLYRNQTTTVRVDDAQTGEEYAIRIEDKTIAFDCEMGWDVGDISAAFIDSVNDKGNDGNGDPLPGAYTYAVASAGDEDDEFVLTDYFTRPFLVEIPDGAVWITGDDAEGDHLTIVAHEDSVQIGLVSAIGPTDLTAIIDDDNEERCAMGFIFSTDIRVSDEPGTIEQVQIDDEITGDSELVPPDDEL